MDYLSIKKSRTNFKKKKIKLMKKIFDDVKKSEAYKKVIEAFPDAELINVELKRIRMTDFSKLMEKAKEIESKMKESQENIKKIEVEGVSELMM